MTALAVCYLLFRVRFIRKHISQVQCIEVRLTHMSKLICYGT